MSETRERLYSSLPAVHRTRDAVEGGDQLRALLAIAEEELDLLEGDVQRLYDDWFIETCQEWVVPYIGDLLGVRGLVEVEGAPFSQRGLVANTIAYRRAKGTVAVLEQLARGVTGWGARAVEYFELLATTRAMNHHRRSDVAIADIRSADPAALTGTPFERAQHLADMRHIDNGRGRYNIPHVGLHVWRLQSYPLGQLERERDRTVSDILATARPVDAATPAEQGRYTFSPLGYDLPLFNVPRAEEDFTHLAAEPNVAAPLRRRPLYDELAERRRSRAAHRTDFAEVYFDDSQPVFRVVLGGEEITPEQVAICDLSDSDDPPPTGWRRPDAAQGLKVGVDPLLGRLALPAGESADTVEVAYAYGFPGDLGGGPYDRTASVAPLLADLPDPKKVPRWQTGVTAAAGPNLFPTLKAAVDAWNTLTPPRIGVIAVMDSRSYDDALTIEVHAGSRLMIVAADWPADDRPGLGLGPERHFGRLLARGRRPHVGGTITVHGVKGAVDVEPGELILDGLLLEQPVTVGAGDLGRLRVAHCTLAPETAGLTVKPGNRRLSVEVMRSISGPLDLPEVPRLEIRDSIVDGRGGAAIPALEADADVQTSTIVGGTQVRTITAGNAIFTDSVTVRHRQAGCVRYCYLPLASIVPRRFRCHPVDEAAAVRVAPAFTSLDLRTGPSAYGQLATLCPSEITQGAEDEGEMGAFNFLKNAQRLTNLITRIDEYLRFGLEAGVVFMS
jgi:hypothetical protein